ncbi:N-acetylmuramoyl-L-alanine amidase [Lysobacter antibioticus]|uniref:N-acetylmuramoyl-L-alanine amidase n=1 Tax=Lysobacter antibioticus TaxID=84531 RepID=UPI0007E8C071|nr:N-acetylmuramoyl-L-alanine amidase [Lysobacter antibioticus]
MRQITALVVHCSATPAGKPFRAADIDRWHREKGWVCIGYHFVIPLDGSVEPGRPVAEPGAHVEGHNRDTIGICLIGGVDSLGKPANTFNERQFEALEMQLRALRSRFPQAKIQGHRDFPGVKKACPSFDVRAWCRARGLDPK